MKSNITFLILIFSINYYSQISSLYIKDSNLIAGDFQIYLIGENHMYKKNNSVLNEVWALLNTKSSVNNVIIEAGPSIEYMMYYFEKDNRTEFNYNANRKVNVLGKNGTYIYKFVPKKFSKNVIYYYVDIETNPKFGNIAILDILSKNLANDEINKINVSVHEKIDKLNFRRREIEISKILISELEPKMDDLAKVINDIDFQYLIRILDNLKKGIEFNCIKDKNLSFKYREAVLYENIKKTLKIHPNEKFIGSLGQIHLLDTLPNIRWSRISNWASMTYQLKKEFKVCNIASIYEKKKLRLVDNLIFENFAINTGLLNIIGEDILSAKKEGFIYKSLDSLSKGEFNLFKLNKEWIYDVRNHYDYLIYCR
ncbi:MAG: hypothetical protein Q8N66_11365 [Bacteroidota bacterium]|nr:hypothetical protein [Bacteroidota bacterium]